MKSLSGSPFSSVCTQNSFAGLKSKNTSLFVLIDNSLYASKVTLLHSLIYNISLRAPRNLELSSAEKNSITLPFANSYLKSDLLKFASTYLLVHLIIFKKSFNAPLLKCGIVSATILISSPDCLAALSINIGSIPNVFPADVPPCIILIRFFKASIFRIAVVTLNID